MYHGGSMLLAEKTHFGPYEIVSLPGAGGIGEVYEAAIRVWSVPLPQDM